MKRVSSRGRSSNTFAEDNIISNGSAIAFGVSSVKASEEDEKYIRDLQALSNPNARAAYMTGATGQAMQTAAGNEGGAMMGFMGMGMAGAQGGNMMNAINQQMAYPPQGGYPGGPGGYAPQGGYPGGPQGYSPQGGPAPAALSTRANSAPAAALKDLDRYLSNHN